MNDIESLCTIFERLEMIDLTHTLQEHIPHYPTHAQYKHTLVETYKHGATACHYELVMSEHTGTHIDSPLHFIDGGKAMSDIPLSVFSGRAATIQATDIGSRGRLEKQHILAWEKENGSIEASDIVLINFGWGMKWETPEQFLKDWPGLSKEAAQYLVEKKVKSVGTDALAIDVDGDSNNPAHFTLLGNNVLIMENLNNLEKLPPFSFFQGYPLKIKNGSGSPIRAVAYIPK